ncbi:MAG: oligosaccharide flippase family protein [Planctomycetes bacterium]|nr:oligosaccharide flippase family protein [Planctomycetota bacterium]
MSFTSASLKQAVRRAGRWVAAAQAVSQLISLAVLASLYRLVAPEDFGLLGMALPLLLFLRIFAAAGLNIATVQRGRLTTEEVSSLFWLNVGWGLATTAAAAALAPAWAWLLQEPRLLPTTLALSGTLFLAAAGLQHQSLLERNLRFGPLAAARLTGQLFGGLAGIAAAFAGAGVWALVIQQYVEWLVLDVGLWIAEPWRPNRIGRGAAVSDLVRLGGYFSGASVMFFFTSNVDKILVGRFLGKYDLGLYSQAFNLMLKPVYLLTTPLAGIVVPAISRARDDRGSLETLFLAFYRLLAVVLLPAGVGLMLVAPEAMQVLGGEQWKPAGPLLAVLAASILVQGFVNIAGYVMAALGRTDASFYANTLTAAVLSVAFVAGLLVGGQMGRPALGVAASYSLTMLLVIGPLYMLYCLRVASIRPQHWLRQLRRPALAALAMGAAVWGCRAVLFSMGLAPLAVLAVAVLGGVAVYAALAWTEIRWCWNQLGRIRTL